MEPMATKDFMQLDAMERAGLLGAYMRAVTGAQYELARYQVAHACGLLRAAYPDADRAYLEVRDDSFGDPVVRVTDLFGSAGVDNDVVEVFHEDTDELDDSAPEDFLTSALANGYEITMILDLKQPA